MYVALIAHMCVYALMEQSHRMYVSSQANECSQLIWLVIVYPFIVILLWFQCAWR